MFVNCEIFRSRKCHVRDKEPFDRRLFRSVHEADDLLQRTGRLEFMLEIQIVVV